MTTSKTPKQKAHKRFQQINSLVDVVSPKLGDPTLVAALLVCWRHADERGYFELSHGRIAKTVGTTRRHAIRLIRKLETVQAIKTVSVGSGVKSNRYRFLDPDGVIDQKSTNPPKE